MYKKSALPIGFFLIVSLIGVTTLAKDLTQRLGVGFRQASVLAIPAVAVNYYPNLDFGVTGAIGIDTENNASRSAFQVGVRRIVFKEQNLNFFMAGSFGAISQEVAKENSSGYETKSGFEFTGTAGAEFFIPGLDSLGFNFESGVGLSNSNKVRFRTVGQSVLTAGMFFYF